MQRISPPSRTQQAYKQLRQELLACRFAPGERLRIVDLCARLSVSQGAVREALSRLTSDGLVETESQRGFRVVPISAADLWHVTTARSDIEASCLDRSIKRGDIDWESRVVAAFHRLANTPLCDTADPQQFGTKFIVAHDSFLEALVSACDNPWLSHMRNLLVVQARRYRGLSEPVANQELVNELRPLMEAALARDTGLATELLRNNMLTRARELLPLLEADGPTS